MLDDDDDI